MPWAWQPEPGAAGDAGWPDGVVAGLWAVAGLALVVPIAAHVWPAAFLPPPTGRLDFASNIRVFKALLVLEGIAALGLAALVAKRGRWLRRARGLEMLDRHAGFGLAFLAGVHALCLLFVLPPQQLLSNEPIHTSAHLSHAYRVFAGDRILSDGGRWSGYDPFFMGGAPAGIAFDWDTRGETLFAHAGAFLGLALAAKGFAVLVHLALPFVLWGTARATGAGRGPAVLGTWAGITFWNAGRPLVGTLRWLGLYSWLAASLLALVALAGASDLLADDHRRRARGAALLAVSSLLLPFVQPAAAVLLLPVFAWLAIAGRGTLRGRDGAAVAAIAALGLMMLALTLLPAWPQRAWLEAAEPAAVVRSASDLAAMLFRPGALPAAFFVAAGTATLLWQISARSPRAILVAGTATTWLVIAVLAGRVEAFTWLDSGRIIVPAMLVLATSAGAALWRGALAIERTGGRACAMLAVVTLLGVPPVLACLDGRFFAVHRLDATLDASVRTLLATLDANAPPEGRVLFERTADRTTPISEGEPLEALVPIHTRRALTGALEPRGIVAASGLELADGRLGGKALDHWSAETLAPLLERWDVSTVVAWSAAARAFVTRWPAILEPVAEVQGFMILRATRAPNAVLEGDGHVVVNYDRIEIQQAYAPAVLLKLHWIDGLEATPAVRLQRVPVDDDPRGLLRVDLAGATRVVIRPRR